MSRPGKRVQDVVLCDEKFQNLVHLSWVLPPPRAELQRENALRTRNFPLENCFFPLVFGPGWLRIATTQRERSPLFSFENAVAVAPELL
jgi:hypothetical protein